MYIEKDIKVFSALIIILCIVFSASLTTNFLAFLNYLMRGEISPLNAEAAPPFCHSSWEDKQMKGSTKQIPI